MNKQQAETLIKTTFENAFDEDQYLRFLRELFNGQIDESDDRKFDYYGQYIPDSFKDYVRRYKRLGTYTDPDGHEIDLLIVILRRESSLDRARTMQRNFAAYHLKRRDKETAIIAYTTEERNDWRFSMVRREPVVAFSEKGNLIAKDELTPVRRYSFLVGQSERSHTAQQQLFPILLDDKHDPTLDGLEEAFNIETVTKEFFERYKALFLQLKEELDRLTTKDSRVQAEFKAKELDTANFAKKLLGQIVFLYFLQKKGWLGVREGDTWGTGPKDFLRQLFDRKWVSYDNFFDDVLEPLFYEALAIERDDNIYPRLKARIPFLNGGLFEPMNNYNWKNTAILIDNNIFEDIFETFDLYNFTVREDEPLEKEVAVDPEMLGKVFENLLEVTDRKSKGAFYTPREIVHYMCQESLINYLDTRVNITQRSLLEGDNQQQKMFDLPPDKGEQLSLTESVSKRIISREDLATFIRVGELAVQNDTAKEAGTVSYTYQMPESIRTHASKLDAALASIKICDPAIGSGAFPVGMMQEIIKAREVLTTYIGESDSRTTYKFKRQAIQESIYGVDVDSSAIDIAKLRLWLSLVVDEDDYHHIKPLPNLDYKIVCGNSLLSVQKTLFNLDLFQKLEKLKKAYFNETNPQEKQKQRAEIDALIAQLTGDHSIFDMQIYFSEVFHGNKGFDVVIANPPYVGERGNKEIFRKIKQGGLGKFYQRKADLFYFFFHLALNVVNDRGYLAFITTNYYLTASQAGNLRRDLKERSNIKKLVNFNELKIFETATGQHNMITILQKCQDIGEPAETSITMHTGHAKSDQLHGILHGYDVKTNYYSVNQKDLYEGTEQYIRLMGTGGDSINSEHDILNILNKLKKEGTSLGILCNVNQGVITGVDKVTNKHIRAGLVPESLKNSGVYVLSRQEIQTLNISEDQANVLRPYFKNSDIQKYFCNTKPMKFVLYLTRDIEISQYPTIYAHVNKFKKVIRNRSENRGEIKAALALGKWWVIFAARNEDIFVGPKIVVPQRSYKNTFAYNESEWFGSADVYFITQREKDVSLKYILALLNSKLYYAWLYHKGKRKGQMLELFQIPLSEIPIKRLDRIQQTSFVELADKIMTTKQKNPKMDTSTLEQQLDQMIYQLYKLTPEEITVVENLYPKE